MFTAEKKESLKRKSQKKVSKETCEASIFSDSKY